MFCGSVEPSCSICASSICIHAQTHLYRRGCGVLTNHPRISVVENIRSLGLAHSAHPPQVGQSSSLCHGPSGIRSDATATFGNTVVTVGASPHGLCLERTQGASAHISLPRACHMAQHDFKQVGNYNPPAGSALTLGKRRMVPRAGPAPQPFPHPWEKSSGAGESAIPTPPPCTLPP